MPGILRFSPTSSPVAGNTIVTITGSGFTPGSTVYFGGLEAYDVTVVDENTITARTPAHLPGEVTLKVDTPQGAVTADGFTYTGQWPDMYERLLLPVFTPPVRGAFGSEFRTEFEASSYSWTPVFGLGNTIDDPPVTAPRFSSATITPNGNPGRFLYTIKFDAPLLQAKLRVYDVSREASNYGTEIKIARSDDFRDLLVFPSVPTDARFRLTMRIYSDFTGALALVKIGNGQAQPVQLRPGANLFDPSYATFSDFPANAGPVRVTVSTPAVTSPAGAPRLWAFITVTNNETQQITTITPN